MGELEKLLQDFADDAAITKRASFIITYLKDASWQINFINSNYPSVKFKALDLKTVVKDAHAWLIQQRKKVKPLYQKYEL